MELRPTINVAIFGCVSVGKSTFLNMLMKDMYSDCHIKRTTTMPQVYHELSKHEFDAMSDEKQQDWDRKLSDLNSIREKNSSVNKECMEEQALKGVSIKIEDIKPLEYVVPPIRDFIKTMSDQHGNNVTLNIFDMPGLNDSMSKDVYFEYVKTNFHMYDIVIFVMDIGSALNTNDEVEILTLVLQGIKDNKAKNINTELISVLNKCDELDFSGASPKPEDPEEQEMVEQACAIIAVKIAEMDVGIELHTSCVSSEHAFIYRMCGDNKVDSLDIKYINKIGKLECSQRDWKKLLDNDKAKRKKVNGFLKRDGFAEGLRLSGYHHFSEQFTKIMTPELQYSLVFNRVNDSLISKTHKWDKQDISDELQWFRETKVAIHNINRIFDKDLNNSFDVYSDELNKFLEQHTVFVTGLNETPSISDFQSMISVISKFMKKNVLFVFGKTEQAKSVLDHCSEKIRSKGVKQLKDTEKQLPEIMEIIKTLLKNKINIHDEVLGVIMNVWDYCDVSAAIAANSAAIAARVISVAAHARASDAADVHTVNIHSAATAVDNTVAHARAATTAAYARSVDTAAANAANAAANAADAAAAYARVAANSDKAMRNPSLSYGIYNFIMTIPEETGILTYDRHVALANASMRYYDLLTNTAKMAVWRLVNSYDRSLGDGYTEEFCYVLKYFRFTPTPTQIIEEIKNKENLHKRVQDMNKSLPGLFMKEVFCD
jgi:GTPase Era involved in 16S rRNA processing